MNKSYQIRSGRMRLNQKIAIEKFGDNYLLPANESLWNLENFFKNQAPIIMEIGFGMGKSLLSMAQERPDLNFLGVEVHTPGVGSLINALNKEKIENILIAHMDVIKVLNIYLKNNSLDGVQIFFPDPWPKKRHNKRRLIQKDFIDLIILKLKNNGFIHCATDWEDYAIQINQVLTSNSMLVQTNKAILLRPMTKFEERGLKLDHKIWDFIFLKQNGMQK